LQIHLEQVYVEMPDLMQWNVRNFWRGGVPVFLRAAKATGAFASPEPGLRVSAASSRKNPSDPGDEFD